MPSFSWPVLHLQVVWLFIGVRLSPQGKASLEQSCALSHFCFQGLASQFLYSPVEHEASPCAPCPLLAPGSI